MTGGAGFIGSHIADALARKGHDVLAIDNLVSGKKENLGKGIHFERKDLVKDELESLFSETESVFHFAADPDVKNSAQNPRASFESNVNGTFRVLEACRKNDVKKMVFASTSTVYGEAKKIPTQEDYPCEPISNYGASKLACEAYCASYAHTYGVRCTVLRYANIYGPRSFHGVMHDFFRKIKKDAGRLEILGNGKQEKSYLYVDDTISATLTAYERQVGKYEVYNVGSRKKHNVDEVARLVCNRMGATPRITYSGGDRGWTGDVREMLLDTSKIEKLGWGERVGFEEGLCKYIDWLVAEKSAAN